MDKRKLKIILNHLFTYQIWETILETIAKPYSVKTFGKRLLIFVKGMFLILTFTS